MSVRVGVSSRRCEEIVKKSRIAPLNAIIIIIVKTTWQAEQQHNVNTTGTALLMAEKDVLFFVFVFVFVFSIQESLTDLTL